MTEDIAAWCERQNRSQDIICPPKNPGKLFSEPFDVACIWTVLEDERFHVAAYLVCGHKERWYACAEQLPRLFVEFANARISEDRLLKLTALMFRWSYRLPEAERPRARQYLADNLDFLGARIQAYIDRQQFQDSYGLWGWREPPWKPR